MEVVPSASSLIIRELNEPPRDRKKEKNGSCLEGLELTCSEAQRKHHSRSGDQGGQGSP